MQRLTSDSREVLKRSEFAQGGVYHVMYGGEEWDNSHISIAYQDSRNSIAPLRSSAVLQQSVNSQFDTISKACTSIINSAYFSMTTASSTQSLLIVRL